MFRFRSQKKRHIPEINMTPMIDVVLQLVIFFVVTTTFISVESGAQVNLPSADFSRIEEAKTITVTITENNSIYIDGALVDEKELAQVAVAEVRQNPQAMVVIEADKNVLHGKVVRVMDILRKSGAEKMAIATQPTEGR
ncbi:MAG TPA: biopolymer transporter ExbD [Candidatus Atribacteria bacterium]|uniref:ExbD/TolR family protein n=1 Tax=Candidatus Sordicultor fermentans TaxID=1953203 RepID=UPI00169D198B|nr:biopolymer transporter ExbD [Atribacterota bacterium]NLY05292.1 biopolymer transporter ExbD [Candidatus Atribacteria bacterium]MDI9608163.1 biopolymer transporter ExbD [Atribacterota bacterium]MDY0134669.1 biopolymer transporter ExbD [Atribacterota bacterium]HOA98460.1 biopolymer transporter ExbD [Candidatus Atribacteria bacterium]